MDNSEREQVVWNAAQFQVQEVTKYLTRATECYLKGDLGRWYYVLTSVREMIDHDLDEPTAKDLDEMERECSKYMVFWNSYAKNNSEGVETTDLKKNNPKFARLIKLYGRRIKQELRNLGYFPTKSMREKVTF